MFKKILALFKRKEKVPTITLTETEVLQWLDNQHTEKLPKIKEQLKEINNGILQTAEQTKQVLVQLHEAQLQNTNIPDREKHFMTGNREAYIKRTHQFLQQLQLLENLGRADEYFSNYIMNVAQYHETTQRPFHIVSQFFKNEVSQVAGKIRDIDVQIEKIKAVISTAKYREWQIAKQEAVEFQKYYDRKQVLVRESQILEKEIEEREKRKKECEEELEEMRKTQEYEQVTTLKENVQDIISKIKLKRLELQETFSSLEQGLKKYARVSFQDEKLILMYLDNSLDALQDDKNLRICMVLQNMKIAIQKAEVQMKVDKKEKTVQDCDNVTKEYLVQYKKVITDLKKQEQELLNRIKAIPIMQDIASKKKEIDAIKEPTGEWKEKLERKGKEREAIALEARRESLAARLTEWAEMPVVLVTKEAEE